jgi:hypothetical protein
MRQIFARDFEPVGMIVIPDRHHDRTRVMNPAAPVAAARLDGERMLSGGSLAFNPGYLLAQRDAQLVSIGDAPVIAQSLHASGLLVRRGEREGADFQQLRCREKNHVPGEMKDRIDQYSFFEHLVIQSRSMRGNSCRQAGRPSSNDYKIAQIHCYDPWFFLVSSSLRG